jgi:hypothetical protein
MELVERPDLDAVKYLNSISFEQFKDDCIREAEENDTKNPTLTDIKTWYSVLKHFCKTTIKTNGVTKRIYAHSLSTPQGVGGRLFSGGSMQGIWSVYRGLLMRDRGTDIDMQNCHPQLLLYICKKHNIECFALDDYVNNRDTCLALFESRSVGKHAYLVATNSDKINKNSDLPHRFKMYDKEMKMIQKQLIRIEEYKNIVESIPEYKASKNFNGSAINRILCKYENDVLQCMIDTITRKGIEIAILMFDGLMVYGDYYNNTGLLSDLERAIETKFPGLGMKLAYKPHDATMSIPLDFVPDEHYEFRHADDDETAARMIIADLKDEMRYSFNRIFIKKDNVWICDPVAVKNHIFVYTLSSNIKKHNAKGEWTSYAQNNRTATAITMNVISILKDESTSDDDFYHKLHSTTKGRLCFKDGVLDFIQRRFFTWDEIDFEYYSPIMINSEYGEYFKNPDRKLSEHIRDTVIKPLFGEKTQIGLQALSRAICGHSEDKDWLYLLGKRDNGKGVIYDTLSAALGRYVGSFELSNILCQRNREDVNEVGRKLAWLLDLEWTRLAISQEIPDPKSGLHLNGKILKKILSGGDVHTVRRNYDVMMTQLILSLTMFIMGNNSLVADDEDVFEKCLEFSTALQFKSQYEIDFLREQYGEDMPLMLEGIHVADPDLKDLVKTPEWSRAIIILLYDYYSTTKVPINRIREDADVNSIRERILSSYEITRNPEDLLPVKEVSGRLDETLRKISNELAGLGVAKKLCKSGCYRNVTCFVGIRKIIQEVSEECLDDV